MIFLKGVERKNMATPIKKRPEVGTEERANQVVGE
jgi:hypothetical protein